MKVSCAIAAIAIYVFSLLSWLYGTTEYIKRHKLNNWNTESNGLIMPCNSTVDLVILGTSRARTFSRFANHERTEKILHRKVLNIARGGGAGVVPMAMELKWFYDRHNHAKTILYFIDPWVLYSHTWNEHNYIANPCFFKEEPFSFDYAFRVYANSGELGLTKYLRAKLKSEWLSYAPLTETYDNSRLYGPTAEGAAKRISCLYDEKLQEANFTRYSKKLSEIVALAEADNARLIFALPPTLLNEPGQERLTNFLRDLQKTHRVEFHDFSKSITDPQFFADYDHLNTKGIVKILNEQILPSLHSKETNAITHARSTL
jgi:hypothetical protein